MKKLIFLGLVLMLIILLISYFKESVHQENEEHQIALVTGASSGIGKALVKELLIQGYEVIGISKTAEKLQALKAEINNDNLSIYACDVSNLNDVKQVSDELKKAKKIPKFFFLNAAATFESLKKQSI